MAGGLKYESCYERCVAFGMAERIYKATMEPALVVKQFQSVPGIVRADFRSFLFTGVLRSHETQHYAA